jgi:hypothetical protein
VQPSKPEIHRLCQRKDTVDTRPWRIAHGR